MIIEVDGNDGKYIVKDPSNIVQLKFDSSGEKNGKSMVHIIPDTIEDNEDRTKVSEKIFEFITK